VAVHLGSSFSLSSYSSVADAVAADAATMTADVVANSLKKGFEAVLCFKVFYFYLSNSSKLTIISIIYRIY
jgi:hypothetical protein